MLISGAFLLALILAGILVAVAGGGGHHNTHSTAQQPAASTTTPTSNPTSSTACTLPPGSQAIPSNSPPVGTQWATVGSMQVPQAPNLYGPQRTHGVFNTCFAHNPSGALLAALNLWAEGTAADPSQVFQKLAVGAPKNLGNNSRLDACGPVQFAGYKIRLLHAHQATIAVVIKGCTGQVRCCSSRRMTWTGTDWKYIFPPNGTPSLEVIPDLTGYVPWSDF